MIVFYFLAVGASFLLSATVGLGGSLIAVPAMIAFLGVKTGVAMAAILLASNNIGKVIAYRRTIPWRSASFLAGLNMLGAFIGAHLLVAIAPRWVMIIVLISLLWSLFTEAMSRFSCLPSPHFTAKKSWLITGLYSLASGLTSGISGTSGPLKGLAIRYFARDRRYYAGAASLISCLGDITKASVFAQASLLSPQDLQFFLFTLPLIPLCVLAGRWCNYKSGEHRFTYLFLLVMVGYTWRLFTLSVS
jgi:hypothetical protein